MFVQIPEEYNVPLELADEIRARCGPIMECMRYDGNLSDQDASHSDDDD